jgi:hypothetical protein
MLNVIETYELRKCLWNVMSKDYKNQTIFLTNNLFDRLNVSEKKFWSGHHIFVNIVHKHCSERSFANNVQSTLFANIAR